MRDSKFGLRAFGLALVAALGLMAFMAVAAQAANLEDGGVSASFLVNKSTALATTGVTFSISQIGTGTLLVPGRTDILCTSGAGTGSFKSSTDALVEIKFTGCTTWATVTSFPHTTKIPCTVKEPIVATALALPKKHEGESYVLLEQEEGVSTFTTVTTEGPECSLPKTNPVTGSVVGLVANSDTTEPKLVFSQAIQKLFQVEKEVEGKKVIKGDQLLYGGLQSYLDAEGSVKLTDAAHAGLTVGVC